MTVRSSLSTDVEMSQQSTQVQSFSANSVFIHLSNQQACFPH